MAALNSRLLSAASFVRQDAVLADIGTDHAYLPLFLLGEGKIKKAFLTDINEGPLASARENAERLALSDKCEFRLTGGAIGLDGLGITDYSVCGMGGELIADIIGASAHLFDPSLRLILQPMTKQEHLRSYLWSHGFEIISEAYSREGEKLYVCFLVRYTGECRELSSFESFVGAKTSKIVNSDLQKVYLSSKIKALRRAAQGKESADINSDFELGLADMIAAFADGL